MRRMAGDLIRAWNQFWFGTHPTAVQRIGMARTFAKASDEVAR